MELAPGSMFAGYRIVALLGQSPTGPVFLVDNTESGAREELHVVGTAKGVPLDVRGRLVDDASAAATTSNPHLVELRRGVQDGTPWFTIPDTGAAIPAQQLPATPQPPASDNATMHVALPPKASAPASHPAPPGPPTPPGPNGAPPRHPAPGRTPPPPPGPRRGPTPPAAPSSAGARHRHPGPEAPAEPAAPSSRRGPIIGAVAALAVIALVIGLILYFTTGGESGTENRARDSAPSAGTGAETPAQRSAGDESIATNGLLSCAIDDGGLLCWNGPSTNVEPSQPARITLKDSGDAAPEAVAVGLRSDEGRQPVCALAGGAVYCADLTNAMVADATDGTVTESQAETVGITGVTAVSLSGYTLCVIRESAPSCLSIDPNAANSASDPGAGSDDEEAGGTSEATAGTIAGIDTPVTGIAVGQNSACAVAEDGALYCWDPRPEIVERPAEPVAGLSKVTDVAVHANTICVVSDEQALCRSTPNGDFREVPGTAGATATALGTTRVWMITDGRLQYAEIGPQPGTPRAVAELSEVTDVSVGADGVCAVAGGGTYCWDQRTDDPGEPISFG